MVQPIIDGLFSKMGTRTAARNDGLRLQLAKGADPWFNYEAKKERVSKLAAGSTHNDERQVQASQKHPKPGSKPSHFFRSLPRKGTTI